MKSELDEDFEMIDLDKPNQSEKSINKKFIILFIVLATFLIISLLSSIIIMHNRTTISKSHVFICDNPSHKSDFDSWLKDDLCLNWVPTYFVVNNGMVIGSFMGDINVNEFKEQLGTVLAFNLPVTEFPEYEIENLNGDRIPANEIFPDCVYILEIVWYDCKDCQHQDENYTKDIYAYFGANNIYRYYINSERTDVEKYYE